MNALAMPQLSTLILTLIQLATAPAATTAGNAPRSADAIFADFVAASGGESPWKSHRSLSLHMRLEITGLGIAGRASSLWTAKGQYLETAEIPNMLTVKRGGDAKRFWSQDPIDGLRWLQGAEAEQMAIMAAWMTTLYLPRVATSSKVVAPLQPNTECIEFQFKQSPTTTTCFDVQTHLLVLETGKKVSPQGETPYTTKVRDYREANGVKLPYVQETTAGPATFVVTVEKVQWDVPAPPALFKLPKPLRSK